MHMSADDERTQCITRNGAHGCGVQDVHEEVDVGWKVVA